MNTRQIIKVKVFSQESYDEEWPPENAMEYLAWFAAKIASIPEEYRASAKVEIDSVSSYENSSYATIKITYTRPETDAEWAGRVAENDARERRQAERERKEFERLRAKFGSSA